MSMDMLEQFTSASSFDKVEFITRTEMIEKLEEAKDCAFTVEFCKKVKENEVGQKL